MTPNGNKKYVKLYFMRHESTETIVDMFRARDWGDFLIVRVDIPQMNPELYEQLAASFREYASREEVTKEVIIIPADWDIEFYGVEVDESGQAELLGEGTGHSS